MIDKQIKTGQEGMKEIINGLGKIVIASSEALKIAYKFYIKKEEIASEEVIDVCFETQDDDVDEISDEEGYEPSEEEVITMVSEETATVVNTKEIIDEMVSMAPPSPKLETTLTRPARQKSAKEE